jgi:hypothetical protein
MDRGGKSAGAESLIGNEKSMPAQWKQGNDQIQWSITNYQIQ